MKDDVTWVEIDLKALTYNFLQCRKLARAQAKTKPKILAVVKSEAYGHGMLPVAKALQKKDVDIFGVSNVEEGITLREGGIPQPILLFESHQKSPVKKIIEYPSA